MTDDSIKHVPKELRSLFSVIVGFTDSFCEAHLNQEYKELCRDMAILLCQNGSPVVAGKPKGWACGIVNAAGWVNFLSDPSQTPHMRNEDIAKLMGVSVGTMHAKCRIIRNGLDLMRLHPDWTLPSKLKDNPLVWILKVNGLMMDIRMAPREAQVEAYRRGLIPFIPADQDLQQLRPESQ